MSKNSKAYREAAEKIDKDHLYTPLEAAKIIAGTARSMGITVKG